MDVYCAFFYSFVFLLFPTLDKFYAYLSLFLSH